MKDLLGFLLGGIEVVDQFGRFGISTPLDGSGGMREMSDCKWVCIILGLEGHIIFFFQVNFSNFRFTVSLFLPLIITGWGESLLWFYSGCSDHFC